MDNRVYWIWLQNAFGAGSPKPVQLVRRIGSAEKAVSGRHTTVELLFVRFG